ncbi:MAG: protein kinase domain-containing protein [Gemmatimonadaceae bacterium]
MGINLLDHLHEALSESYAIERELAGGGMSRVFLAEERALGRRVVVKVLLPELLAGVSAERFRREIQLTARLQHPHIVPILATGEADGLPFYTMPFEEGESLRVGLARAGALPILEAMSILRDVARALEYAHDKGIIHRDIKPDNILLAGNTATVADFGIAKAIAASRAGGESAMLTEAGMAIGTPQYMAPEQIAADPAVDHRVDIYAFGCVAYELLSGEAPFAGRSPTALLRAHIVEHPSMIGARRADVPAALAAMVDRCLEKDPQDRPANARQLLDALDAAAANSAQGSVSGSPAAGRGTLSVAVLPFANLSADDDNEYFADGLTEELITDLSMLKTLRVISRQSAMRFKGTDKDVRTIARELGTRYVLTGGVRRSGANLRITAQLVDATIDAPLWAEKFTGLLVDVFDMQERLSRQIVDALRVRLTPAEERRMAQHPIADVRAYELYLRARQHIWSFSGASLDRALQLIREAQEIVGDNELLFAAEGWIYWQYVNVGLRPASTYDHYLRKAEECAERIFAIDPESSKGHGLRGAIRNHRADPVGSLRDYKRALALDPNDPEALLWLGYGYAVSGRIPLAVALMERLLHVDPLTSVNVCMRGMVAMLDGRFDEALGWTQRSVDIDPDNPTARMMHAWMLAAVGRRDEAIAMLEHVAPEAPEMTWANMATPMACALRGDVTSASQAVTPELHAAAWWDDLFCWWTADCFALVGDHAMALQFLERSVELGMINYPFLALHDPFLATLRGEERYHRLMDRVRRAWELFEA